ncbi:hypothetical protein HWI79_2599 [Cryptosporidium felis]|nr:hypothetical protein HWI79_2599 [Cryptosporidium felis]
MSLLLFFMTTMVNLPPRDTRASTSFMKLRSSATTSGHLSLRDCINLAEEYLQFLGLKNDLYFRLRATSGYKSLFERENDPDLKKEYEQKLSKSMALLTKASSKVAESDTRSRELFDLLLKCLGIYGADFSPEGILERNKSSLKFLTSAGTI